MKCLFKFNVLLQSTCTLFFLIGISLFMFSCSPSIEKKVKKYEKEGKTIIVSTMGQETKNHCIVFADADGVYFDNMKNVSQLLIFGKSYTCVSPELSIPCEKKGLEIRVSSWEYAFTQENIDDFEIYPIGQLLFLGEMNPVPIFHPSLCKMGAIPFFL